MFFIAYDDMVKARMLPSSEVIVAVVSVLQRLGEMAIALRILEQWVLQRGRLDWDVVRIVPDLTRTGLSVSSRYVSQKVPSESSDDIGVSVGENQVEANEEFSSASVKSHLGHLDRLLVDIELPFAEDLDDIQRKKLFLLDLVSRIITNRLRGHQIGLKSGSKSCFLTSEVPIIDIIMKMSSHITIQGNIDLVIRDLMSRNSFQPVSFWSNLIDGLLTDYIKEWRVFLMVWERIRLDLFFTEKGRLTAFASIIASLLHCQDITVVKKFIDSNREALGLHAVDNISQVVGILKSSIMSKRLNNAAKILREELLVYLESAVAPDSELPKTIN